MGSCVKLFDFELISATEMCCIERFEGNIIEKKMSSILPLFSLSYDNFSSPVDEG